MANKKLDVYYHGLHVGTLAEMPNKKIAFQYSTEWQRSGFSLNPLYLPLNNTVFIPPDKNIDIFQGLFGTFADSLPDAWGNLLMRNYFASIELNVNDMSTIEKLAYVGSSGMGALEYYPSKPIDFHIKNFDMNYDQLAYECNKVLSSKESEHLDLLFELAGSSGGTRPKIHIKELDDEWIVKFPAKSDPAISGKREYDYSICAKNCGIYMTDTFLIPSSTCDGYFKTKRFDRVNGEKIFTSSFAALLNVDYNTPSCDYTTYMKLIQILTKDCERDKQQMFRQMCFNVLTHNRDDHTKNFAFTYTNDSGWHLSPAYDITYSNTYYGEQTTTVNGKGKDITENDMITVGIKAGLSKKFCIDVLDTIKESIRPLQHYLSSRKRQSGKKVELSKRLSELKS